MKVLHIAPTFYPATYWGGPIWSTKAICDGIADQPDMDLRVLTTDAAGPAVAERVTPIALPYPIAYCRRVAGHSVAPALFAKLPHAIAAADVVHLTGTYSAPSLPTFGWCKLLGKPLVWSPRGALQATQDWQDAPRRRAKLVFENTLNLLRPRQIVMHVTAQAEAAQSVRRFGGVVTKIIPNAVDVPERLLQKSPCAGGLRLMSLGRIHPKKGLDILIAALGQLPPDVTLDIYGTGAPEDIARLRAQARALGNRVRFCGQLQDVDKAAAFAKADLFVLPSHSENFGIVIAEALAHAVPVLTTMGTPWQGLDRTGCGRCVPLSQDRLVREIAAMRTLDLPAMGARGRAWMQRDFSKAAMTQSFAALYQSLVPATGQEVPA